MKCPICGKEEFIKPETSLIISSYERLTVTPEIHVCVNCGFVIMQNAFLGEKYKKAIEEVNELKKEIEKLDQEMKLHQKNMTHFIQRKDMGIPK